MTFSTEPTVLEGLPAEYGVGGMIIRLFCSLLADKKCIHSIFYCKSWWFGGEVQSKLLCTKEGVESSFGKHVYL